MTIDLPSPKVDDTSTGTFAGVLIAVCTGAVMLLRCAAR